MIDAILYAFYYTMPLWIFLAILAVALFIEAGIIAHHRKKLVDNPTLW